MEPPCSWTIPRTCWTVLVDYPEDMLDPIDIAMLEFDKDLIPITVVRN